MTAPGAPHPPKPIPLAEAQERLLGAIEPLAGVDLPVEAALERYLSADALAHRTQPVADFSAMDGYAMPANDLSGPWKVVGESAAGHPFDGVLARGQAVRISTGAMMPKGGGAVLLQENASRNGDTLVLNGEGDPTPRHIRRAGFDFKTGDILVPAGKRMDAASIALAISGGNTHVSVTGRPTLAIVDSGDELAPDPANVPAHQIPASNGAMLAAMAAPYADDIRRLGPVRDRQEDLVAAFEAAADCDVIVTSGGASVGDHDLVRPALQEWGATIDFWRIAMKPGKPLMVARKGKTLILGLPGNPVSSYVTAYLLLLPLLRKLGGSANPLPGTLSLPLGSALGATGKRMEFVRAKITDGMAIPLGEQDSSALVALSRADCLIRRDIDSPPADPGTMLPVYPLQNGGIA